MQISNYSRNNYKSIKKSCPSTICNKIHGQKKENQAILDNTGLVPSRGNLTSWGGSASLALFGHHSSGGVTIKILYVVDVFLHQPASHPVFSYWFG